MNSQRYVDEERASVLLGMSAAEVHRLAQEAGIGQDVLESGTTHRVFTFVELYRMCRLAAHACLY